MTIPHRCERNANDPANAFTMSEKNVCRCSLLGNTRGHLGNHPHAQQNRADARGRGLEGNRAAPRQCNPTRGGPLPRRAGGQKIAAQQLMAVIGGGTAAGADVRMTGFQLEGRPGPSAKILQCGRGPERYGKVHRALSIVRDRHNRSKELAI
jgi:hypothetical protein